MLRSLSEFRVAFRANELRARKLRGRWEGEAVRKTPSKASKACSQMKWIKPLAKHCYR